VVANDAQQGGDAVVVFEARSLPLATSAIPRALSSDE
jgi:hypothetical protein